MDVRFHVGDWIKRPESHYAYVVDNVDKFTEPIPAYYVHMVSNPNIKFWDYCIGWEKIKEEQ